MTKILGRTLKLLVGLCCFGSMLPTWGQQAGIQLTPELLQNQIAAVQESVQLDDGAKARLIDLYRQSINNLENARANRAAAESFRQARRTAPAETDKRLARIEARRGSDPVADLDISARIPLELLVRRLDEEFANEAAVEAKVAVLDARIEVEAARPSKARQRIAAARAEVEELAGQSGFQPPDNQAPQMADAARWASQTRLEALQTEIAMLDEELLSYSLRNDLLKAEREEAAQSLGRIRQRVNVLRDAIIERRRLEAESAMQQAQASLEGSSSAEPLIRQLAQANLALVQRLQAQVEELDSVAARERGRPRTSQIDSAFRSARRKLDLEGTGAPVGLAILEQRRQFPSAREYLVERRAVGSSITTVSLRLIEAEEERRDISNITAYVDDQIAAAGDRQVTPEARQELKDLAKTRRSLLDRSISNDNALQQRLYDLDDALQHLAERTNAYDKYLAERLLWVRSSQRVSADTLTRLPRDVARYLAPGQWLEVIRFAGRRLVDAPIFLLILVAGLALAWRRKSLRSALIESGRQVGRIRQDSMHTTFRALGCTLLLGAPIPLVLAGAGGSLATAPEGADFPNSVGLALLQTAAWLWFPVTLRVLFYTGGVGERHFGWHGPTLRRVRRQLGWYIAVAFPAYFVTLTSLTVEGGSAKGAGALTLLAFIVVMVSLLIFVVGLMHPTRGAIRDVLAAHPHGQWWRWRYLWFPFFLLVPIVLMTLAVLGYDYTTQQLGRKLFQSIWFLLVIWLGAALVQRWLLMTGRRLAYEEAMAAREAARARRAGESETAAAEPVVEDDIGAQDVDLVALGVDTRQLLNATILVVAVLGLVGIWGDVLPALSILEEFSLWDKTALVDGINQDVPVTLADLLLAVLITVGGYVLATNLPSLLDIILLKQGGVSAGGRYTVATLTRYTVTAIAALVVLRLLGLNASQLGWAAAALGVGIGFGLQEIVANFICGLILLFERPIRVGDTITVGEATGAVTKIRIRATTIRDWEQKELVVPNKELITGRLLNWSLSDAVTRLMIQVGVAYGSDVERAMALIREAAEENDHVLDEPAPSVHFEQFADSSLNLTLRAFVGQLSERLQTITELHKAIDSKFRSAGVVIAFPQRDVHVYSSDGDSPSPSLESEAAPAS